MSQPQVVVRNEYASTYKQIPVSAFVTTISEKGLELTAYVEEEDFKPEGMIQPGVIYVKRMIETRLAVNPIQLKLLYTLLGRQLENYEKVYGKIPTPEEVNTRIVEMSKQQQPATTTTSTKSSVGIQ
jgi:hypothetical protein